MERTALVIVDIQPIYVNQIPNEAFEQSVSATLQKMRQFLPCQNIIHVRANYENTMLRPRIRELNPHFPIPTIDDINATEWAAEKVGELVIQKSTYDGFYNTDLDGYLRSKNVQKLYIIGMLTSICVHETAVGAIARGFSVTLIEDACMDRTAERHAMVLKLYKDYVYETCTLADVNSAV